MIAVDRGLVAMGVTQYTTVNSIVGGHIVTLGTESPNPFMFTTVDWKILSIMIVCRRCPSCCGMATFAIRWKFSTYVIWICRGIVFGSMTSITKC